MRKLNNPMPAGGAPFNNEDLIELFNTEIWDVAQAMLSLVDSDTEGLIVKGCDVVANGGNFDISAGIVYINGEFMRLDAATNQTFPKYIVAGTPTNVNRTFNDSGSKTFLIEKKAILSGTPSGQYISINNLVGPAILRNMKTFWRKSTDTWTNIPLINGWAAFGGYTPQYKLDNGGRVYLWGELSAAGSSSSVISTGLPAPKGSKPHQFATVAGDGSGIIKIDIAGTQLTVLSSDYTLGIRVRLDHISYWTR